MVRHTIEQLRERPRHERHAVAVWLALVVVVVLLILWMMTFLGSMRKFSRNQAASAAAAVAHDTVASEGTDSAPSSVTIDATGVVSQ